MIICHAVLQYFQAANQNESENHQTCVIRSQYQRFIYKQKHKEHPLLHLAKSWSIPHFFLILFACCYGCLFFCKHQPDEFYAHEQGFKCPRIHKVFHLGLVITSVDLVLQFEMKLLSSHLLSVTRKICNKSI